jgi:hypothetical protein
MRIEKMHAAKWFKCVCCCEQIRTDEIYLQVVNDNGKIIRGERYCLSCEDGAIQNNEIIDNEDDGERGLRQQEDYAAYQAAGCTAEYWTDRDNGYAH